MFPFYGTLQADYFKRLPLYQRAKDIFGSMQKKGCIPNAVTYNTVIKACTTAAEAERIWEHMKAYGARVVRCAEASVAVSCLLPRNNITPDARFFNVMLSIMAQRGNLPRVVYFTDMMRGLVRHIARIRSLYRLMTD